MKKVKFTAIIGMAMMMFVPAISLADNGTQVEVVSEASVTVKVPILITVEF